MVYITPLVINAFEGGHTQTHTHPRMNKNDFKKPGARGLWLHAPGLKSRIGIEKVKMYAKT